MKEFVACVWRVIYSVDDVDAVVRIKHIRLKIGAKTYDNIDTS
jgi:hypothetical protein